MFGKKTGSASEPPKAVPESRDGGSEGNGGNDERPMPWAGWPDEIGCNFAAGHLVRNLQILITVEGRVHAETLMTAAGAIAGWAAQRSLMANSEALSAAEKQGQLSVATMKDGRRLLFGDAINAMLIANDPALASRCVWNWLAGTATTNGLAQSDIPDVQTMFAHVTRELGGPREGFPSTPAPHQPGASAGQILDRVLPLTVACLTGEIDSITKKNGFRADMTSYQAITAWSAAKILAQCCSVMSPDIALTIGMEAAIYASKLMPQATAPQA